MAMVVAITVAGCGNYFEAYRGVDLIAQRGLSMSDWQPAYLVPDADAPVDYISLTEDASNGGYRLEVPNLLPDGDFESSTAGSVPDNWETALPDGFFSVRAAGTTDSIQGQSVEFEIGVREYGRVPLSNLLDGLQLDGLYSVTLQFRRGAVDQVITFEYGDEDSSLLKESSGELRWSLDAAAGATETPVETFPTRPEENDDRTNLAIPNVFEALASPDITGDRSFYIGAPAAGDSFTPQTGWVDNIRIARLDVGAHMALAIPQVEDADANEDGLTDTFPLVAGEYVFSVEVKALPDSAVTPNEPNRFRAPQVVLGANRQLSTAFDSDTEGWDAETWVTVSAIVSITDDEITTDPPLTLMMSVLNPQQLLVSEPNYTAAGALLIRNPTLELYQP